MRSSVAEPPAAVALEGSFEQVLTELAERAGELDASPRFPAESFASLAAAGVPQLAADRHSISFEREVSLVRAVAAADASVARILDGHFNGAERLALSAPEGVALPELAAIAEGRLLLGVWGADPAPGEGPAARIVATRGGVLALDGVKTFCSGAGGVGRALVVARDESERRRLAYVDLGEAVEIDRGWYKASGLKASESHRVVFRQAPVLALLGGEDELLREPWLSRDSLRSAATWAGIADGIAEATLANVSSMKLDELRLQSLGRMRLARSSIDRWIAHAVSAMGEPSELIEEPAQAAARVLARESRLAIADAARTISAEAARVCGSRALVGGGPLDRGRRDLDLFLLQHRLDPLLVELGARTIETGWR
jgi:alkylation response protein AidB-like acyl-CoA dehydrogenase